MTDCMAAISESEATSSGRNRRRLMPTPLWSSIESEGDSSDKSGGTGPFCSTRVKKRKAAEAELADIIVQRT